MKSREIINKVKKNKLIMHTGDLSIEGDVDENAEIRILDGSLIISGNIKDGAKVYLAISEELRNVSSMNSEGGIPIVSGFNNAIYENESFMSSNKQMNFGNQKIMIGNVNINNRILTDDMVTELGVSKYKITPANVNPYGNFNNTGKCITNGMVQQKSTAGFATATIDGKIYQGKEIIVDGIKVIIDGNKFFSLNDSLESKQKLTEKPKLIIHGNIGNFVKINSDAEIHVKGNVGNSCHIQSFYSRISANKIGKETTIDVSKSITVTNVGKNCILKSQKSGLNATSLKGNSKVIVNKSIIIDGDIGNGCYLESTHNNLKAHNIGEHITAKINNHISVNNIGSHSTLTSQYKNIEANDVSDNVSIHANNNVTLNSVGEKCGIKSDCKNIQINKSMGDNVVIQANADVTLNNTGNHCEIKSNFSSVTVNKSVGHNVKIIAHDEIEIGNTLGNNSRLTSQYKDIMIKGNSGDKVIIRANNSVNAQDIGNNSSITSTYKEVKVKNIGEGVSINAMNGIIINGWCPKHANLKTTYGKIKKASHINLKPPVIEVLTNSNNVNVSHQPAHQQSVYQQTINNNYNINNTNAYLADTYERDLQYAIALSKTQAQQNTIRVSTVVPEQKNNQHIKNTIPFSNVKVLQKQGLLSVPSILPVQKNNIKVEIPESYKCIITQEIMTKPVICILDGKTYEEAAIKQWLQQSRNSPHNREKMKPNQSVDDVLVVNRNLEDAIEEFRNNNPQLFSKTGLNM